MSASIRLTRELQDLIADACRWQDRADYELGALYEQAEESLNYTRADECAADMGYAARGLLASLLRLLQEAGA